MNERIPNYGELTAEDIEIISSRRQPYLANFSAHDRDVAVVNIIATDPYEWQNRANRRAWLAGFGMDASEQNEAFYEAFEETDILGQPVEDSDPIEDGETDDGWPVGSEYADGSYEDYEPSPYDGTYSED